MHYIIIWSRLCESMSLQKLFLLSFYLLGTSRTKLRDAWYVSNVSIISYVPCFIYTFISFYAFSGTNLLTRCHSASSLFSAVFGFRKPLKEIFSKLDEINTKVPIFHGRFQNTEEDTEEDPEGPTPPPSAGPPGRASTGCGALEAPWWGAGAAGGWGRAPSSSGRLGARLRLVFDVLDCSEENRDFGIKIVQFREYFLKWFSETKNNRKQGTDIVASC